MAASFVWNELATTDVERAKAFYEATFGWTFEVYDIPGSDTFWVAKVGDKYVGGLSDLAGGSDPSATASAWTSYVGVDEIDQRVEKARALGATIVQEPIDVPNVGRIAVLRDPTGALIGLIMEQT